MATQIGQQGWSQQTPAALQIIRSGLGVARSVSSGKRKRRSATATSKKPKKRASSSTKRKASSAGSKLKRLVKGSAAAKAYMKKLRNLRK